MKEVLNRMAAGTFLEKLVGRLCSPSIQDPDRLYNVQTFEVMKKVLQRDSNCIDVGCHAGEILSNILSLAPNGRHYAFEPIPAMYQTLRNNFGGNAGVRVFDYALSDSTGSSTFQHVTSNPGYSGLRQRRYDRPNEVIEEITVKTERLDNLIPGEVPIHFIKIDVEGAELQVLRGAIETIRRSRPVIVFEHGLGAADCYGTTPEALYDLLAGQCGLRLFLMARWLDSGGSEFLSREAFCEQFYSGRHYYFMAAR